MELVRIDSGSDVPPYEQVRLQLATRITQGVLPVGAKLPTVRSLAGSLGVAANTVARAYRELDEAGLVETRGRAGTFVGSAGDESRARIHRAAQEFARVAHALGLSHDEALGVVEAAVRGEPPPHLR
jgi:DNA-binding transcriptional regulator YhcF (GntR family)